MKFLLWGRGDVKLLEAEWKTCTDLLSVGFISGDFGAT